MCRKAGNKLSVQARLSNNFVSFTQRRILLKIFIESQFGYCPLIWMFYSRRVNNKNTRTLTYNLRSQADVVRDCVNTRRYCLNSLSYFAPKVWNMIPSEIKNINSLRKFKTEILQWAPVKMGSFYLCRPYMQNLGFVDLI